MMSNNPYQWSRLVLQPDNAKWLGVAVFFIACIAYLTPSYRPIVAALQLRYQESQGRSPKQLEEQAQQRASAEQERARQAAEAAQREQELRRREEQRIAAAQTEQQQAEQRRQAAETQRRIDEQARGDEQQRYQRTLAAYRNRIASVPQYTTPLVREAEELERSLEAEAVTPRFYSTNKLAVEATASMRPCTSGSSFWSGARENMLACLVHFAINKRNAQENAKQRHIMHMTYERLTNPTNGREVFPFSIIILYSWMELYNRALVTVDRSELPSAFPPLVKGNSINRDIIQTTMESSFLNVLISTATEDEKVHLRDSVYPFLVTVHDEVNQLITSCRILSITPCGVR